MASMSNYHRELTDGVGKCSVPMWDDGCPAGFCNNHAYGNPLPGAAYPGYVPGLACHFHGGPAAPPLGADEQLSEGASKCPGGVEPLGCHCCGHEVATNFTLVGGTYHAEVECDKCNLVLSVPYLGDYAVDDDLIDPNDWEFKTGEEAMVEAINRWNTRADVLKQLMAAFDAAEEDAAWEEGHPILQMAAHIDKLKAKLKAIDAIVFEEGMDDAWDSMAAIQGLL